MKTWTMPIIKIDLFAANEFVSSCTPTPLPNVTKSKYAYIDWNPTDYMISEGGNERLRKTSSSHDYYEAGDGVRAGYYNDVNVYKVNPETGLTTVPSGGPWAFDATYQHPDKGVLPLFELIGTYDIWVKNRTEVYTYRSSQWDGGTDPTHAVS